jgi:hypothetical protein
MVAFNDFFYHAWNPQTLIHVYLFGRRLENLIELKVFPLLYIIWVIIYVDNRVRDVSDNLF